MRRTVPLPSMSANTRLFPAATPVAGAPLRPNDACPAWPFRPLGFSKVYQRVSTGLPGISYRVGAEASESEAGAGWAPADLFVSRPTARASRPGATRRLRRFVDRGEVMVCRAKFILETLPDFDSLCQARTGKAVLRVPSPKATGSRSEEHTSELQSLRHLVFRL